MPLYNKVLQLGRLQRTEAEQEDPADSTFGQLPVLPRWEVHLLQRNLARACAPEKGENHWNLARSTHQMFYLHHAWCPLPLMWWPLLALPPCTSWGNSHQLYQTLPTMLFCWLNHSYFSDVPTLLNICSYQSICKSMEITNQYKSSAGVPANSHLSVMAWTAQKEYTNTQLRRQLVMEVIKHKEFFLQILWEHYAMNYGAIRLTEEEYKLKCADNSISAEQRCMYHEPGPFSLYTYLKHILNRSSWGNEITLILLSMMFRVFQGGQTVCYPQGTTFHTRLDMLVIRWYSI